MYLVIRRVILIIITCHITALSQVPMIIDYQGHLQNNNVPIDGNEIIKFTLFPQLTGGTAIWEESHNVEVEEGLFTVKLGSVVPLQMEYFSHENLFLEIELQNEVLEPRLEFTSVAYSLIAGSVADQVIEARHIRDSSITEEKLISGISAFPKGIAGGDLAGNYPNPIVRKLQGNNISQSDPENGQILKWDGNEWSLSDDETTVGTGGGTVTRISTSGGLIGGPITDTGTVRIKELGIGTNMLQNNSVTTEKLAPDIIISPSGIAGGDLSGSYPSPTVNRIQGNSISNDNPEVGEVLKWDGNNWKPDEDISEAGSGGGTVTQINTGSGLSGGPITGSGTISILNNGITRSMLQDNLINSSNVENNSLTTDDIFDDIISTINGISNDGGDIIFKEGENIKIENDINSKSITFSAEGGSSNTWNHVASSNINLNGYFISGDGSDGGIYFSNNNSLGLGNSSPTSILSIGNSNKSENHISIFSSDYGGILFSNSSNDWSGGINFYHAGKALLFDTDGPGSAKMVITNDGKVGIKTGDENNLNKLQYTLQLGLSTDNLNYMRISSDERGGIKFHDGASGDYSAEVSYYHPSDYMYFRTKSPNGIPEEKMRITSGGNVGIGTTNPVGRLDVNGPIYQRGGVLHADYVFDDDYNLESVKEHAEFMWKNKHLPAMPKAQLDSDGNEIVEVGSHRRGIVEELEKAHIYIWQIEEQLKEQYKLTKELIDRIEDLEKLNKQK